MPKTGRKIKNIIFLGRKPGAAKALEYIVGKGLSVNLVIAPQKEECSPRLSDTAKKYKIAVRHDDGVIYSRIAKSDRLISDTDLVISYLFWRKIRQPLIDVAKFGCINFHPAPLPDYRGRAGYNTAILDERKKYGVSAHFIDSEQFDSGPIIRVLKFPINPMRETALSLEKKSQDKLLQLFKDTMDAFIGGRKIKTRKNHGGLYLTGHELEELKKINLKKDSLEDIDKKIRAFFFPPHRGATINIKGKKFTLINDEVMKLIHSLIKNN